MRVVSVRQRFASARSVTYPRHMFYRLGYEYPIDADGGHYTIEDGVDFEGVRSWSLGCRFTHAVLPSPIELDLVPVGGFSGSPPDMLDGNMCLMSEVMASTLFTAGVDNLDCYPATLFDRVNQRRFDYHAVNILGLVKAADLDRSDWSSFDADARMDTHFAQLRVDPGKASALAIFRLAEDTGTIVVVERVKQALEARGLGTLTFSKAFP